MHSSDFLFGKSQPHLLPPDFFTLKPREEENKKEAILASFCANCGAALSPGNQACAACGAPAAGVPFAAPVLTATPAASTGGSALKIVLIIVAIVVGLGILGMGAAGFAVWRISRAIHVNGHNGQMTMQTPGGTITADSSQSFTASELGTDVYPGAQSVHGGMRMNLPTGSMVTGGFVTSDSKEQVLDYYKSKLGSGASTYDSGDSAMVTLGRGEQETIMVTISARASQEDGKTRIAIVHTKANKP